MPGDDTTIYEAAAITGKQPVDGRMGKFSWLTVHIGRLKHSDCLLVEVIVHYFLQIFHAQRLIEKTFDVWMRFGTGLILWIQGGCEH